MSGDQGDRSTAVPTSGASEPNERIPEIGTAWRPYDIAHGAVRVMQRSPLWSAVPLRMQVWLSGPFMQRLMAAHQLDEHRARPVDDGRHSLIVDADGRVTLSTIWVVELFPPGEAPRLQGALVRNRWQQSPHLYPFTPASETLDRSRSGTGPSWWKVAHLVDARARGWSPGARRDRLPEAFDAVEIFAVQFGAALTGVVARFDVAHEAARALDRTWHSTAKPRIHRQPNGLPLAEDRLWTTMRATQRAQLELHDEARRWMTRRCPGTFASSAVPATTLGLLLFDGLDPLDDDRERGPRQDHLRALGVCEPPTHLCTTADLPGLSVEKVDRELCPTLGATDVHLLAGRRDRVGAALGPKHGISGDLDATFIGRVVDSVEFRNYMVLQAVDTLLGTLEKGHAQLRDRARDQHRALSARAVRDLRARVLAQNIDLDSLVAALADFRARDDYDSQVMRFHYDLGPRIRRRDAEHGRPPFEPVDAIERQLEQQTAACALLQERDDRLRDVLATATSLGSSADTFRISRFTLLIALTSLVVAALSLSIAEPGAHSLLNTLNDLLRDLLLGSQPPSPSPSPP